MIREASQCSRPRFIPTSGHTRAQKAGLRFERQIGTILKDSDVGQVQSQKWFSYSQRGKVKWCQTDHLIVLLDRVIVVEVKLTWKYESDVKLKSLYVPVVGKVFDLPVKALLVVRNLSRGAPQPTTLSQAVSRLLGPSPPRFLLAQEFI